MRTPSKTQLIAQSLLRYFATMKSLLDLTWQTSPKLFIALLILTLLTGLIPPANIFIISTIVESLTQAAKLPLSPSTLSGDMIFLLTLLGGVSLFGQLANQLSTTVQSLYQARISDRVQLMIAEKAVSMDLSFFENPRFHNQMQNVSSQASFRPLMILQELMRVASTLTSLIAMAIIIVLWYPWIVFLIFFCSLAMLWVSVHHGKEHVELAQKQAENERQKQYLRTLISSESSAKEIRLFGLRDFLISKFHALLKITYQQNLQLSTRSLLRSGMSEVFLSIVQPLIIGFAVLQTTQRLISIGQFILYTQSIISFQSMLNTLMYNMGTLHENTMFVAELFGFLSLQPDIEANRPNSHAYSASISNAPSIEFRDVSFRYPDTDLLILEHLSFKINPGESVALVGENGTGKSTIVKLLAGLYEPTGGEILLDGIDISVLDRDALRAYLSVIFQDYTVYHFSVYDNIGLGQVAAMHDHERIEDSAQRSGLERVVMELPNRYNTVLGRFWNSGHELSGGQRQLVALARSLMRRSSILIMDEPSSALDIYTEQHFFQQILDDQTNGQLQTVMFVSHRFTTVRRAQRIFVLSKGKLIEQGSHDSLMALDGHYAEMFKLHAQMYTASSEQDGSNGVAIGQDGSG